MMTVHRPSSSSLHFEGELDEETSDLAVYREPEHIEFETCGLDNTTHSVILTFAQAKEIVSFIESWT